MEELSLGYSLWVSSLSPEYFLKRLRLRQVLGGKKDKTSVTAQQRPLQGPTGPKGGTVSPVPLV
jgi:hypothetical protein